MNNTYRDGRLIPGEVSRLSCKEKMIAAISPAKRNVPGEKKK